MNLSELWNQLWNILFSVTFAFFYSLFTDHLIRKIFDVSISQQSEDKLELQNIKLKCIIPEVHPGVNTAYLAVSLILYREVIQPIIGERSFEMSRFNSILVLSACMLAIYSTNLWKEEHKKRIHNLDNYISNAKTNKKLCEQTEKRVTKIGFLTFGLFMIIAQWC